MAPVDLRKANELFHDCESGRYDDKWGIQYDRDNALRVRKKFEKVYGASFPRVSKMLEVGCGTGYVGLNLCLNDNLVDEMYSCDISQGMVDACLDNARILGIPVSAKRSEMESLAYPDGEFDMVIGHAILHHIPDIRKALAEVYRVLAPGGVCMLAGEPTRTGDRLGDIARRSTSRAVKWYARHGGYFGGVRAELRPESGAGSLSEEDPRHFEDVVDIHTFKPSEVCAMAREVGFSEARYETEELLCSFVGWVTRTIENTLSEENLTFRWRYWSYTTYLKLNRVDELIYPYLPSGWFYNMLLFVRKPL